MTSSNTEVIRELRAIIKEGKSVDLDTRDRLLFTAIIDIYEKLEIFVPILTFYKISVFILTASGTIVIGLIFGLVTGQIELIFK